VAIFGIGGVGSFVAEGLVRAGVGKFVLVDPERICITNINRQIHATTKTVGMPKIQVMKQRMLEINPEVEIHVYPTFYLPNQVESDDLIDSATDYIIDAVDTVAAKVELLINAKSKGIPIISSMGVGNRLDPTKLKVGDIYDTSICKLARAVRKKLRALEIDSLKVVYSKEEPLKPILNSYDECTCKGCESIKITQKSNFPGSISFVPSVAGLMIAGEVVKELASL